MLQKMTQTIFSDFILITLLIISVGKATGPALIGTGDVINCEIQLNFPTIFICLVEMKGGERCVI